MLDVARRSMSCTCTWVATDYALRRMADVEVLISQRLESHESFDSQRYEAHDNVDMMQCDSSTPLCCMFAKWCQFMTVYRAPSEMLKDSDSTGLLQVDRAGIVWRAFAAPSRGRSSHSVEVTIHLTGNHPFCLIVPLACTQTPNRLITLSLIHI